MPQLQDFLSAYRGREAQMQAAPMQELQQVGALQGILANVQKQKMAQQEMQDQQMMKSAVQQTGGDPQVAIQKLLATGHPKAIELATKMKAAFAKPEGQAIGSGGLRLPDGTIVPPATKPAESWSEPFQMGGAWVQRSSTGQVRQSVAREPQTHIRMPDPVTSLTVQDTTSPTGWSFKDGRTGRILSQGAPPPASDARTKKIVDAKAKSLRELDMAIGEIDKAAADGGLIDKSTGSGAGALVDAAAGFVGKATPGSIAVGQLKPIYDLALKMVPRFEGPQSDKDTKSYQDASGNLANPNVPNETKKKAAKEIVRLMRQRRGQFITKEYAGTDVDSNPEPATPPNPTPRNRRSSDWKDL